MNRKAAPVENTGFGASTAAQGRRLTQKDGSANIRKTGLPFWQRLSIFHTLLHMPTAAFFATMVAFYTVLNIAFAGLYFIIGVEHLAGTEAAVTPTEKLTEAFFFSSQTLTTLGYGRVAPVGVLTNTVAFFEALIGILSFAVVTGLMYGRFARPKAYILFSEKAVVAPYEGGSALMMRLASYKNNLLTDLEAQLTIAVQEEGAKLDFYRAPLELSTISSLALSWTVVHPITEDSPLANFSEADYRNKHIEIILAVKGFDDHFATTVQQRTSYAGDEIRYGEQFVRMFERAEHGAYTRVMLDKIDETVTASLAGAKPLPPGAYA